MHALGQITRGVTEKWHLALVGEAIVRAVVLVRAKERQRAVGPFDFPKWLVMVKS